MNAVEAQRNYGDWIAKYGVGEEPRRANMAKLEALAVNMSDRMRDRLEEFVHGLSDEDVAEMAAALELCPDFDD